MNIYLKTSSHNPVRNPTTMPLPLGVDVDVESPPHPAFIWWGECAVPTSDETEDLFQLTKTSS